MYKRHFHLDFNPYWFHIIEENTYENINTAGKIRVCTSRKITPSHISLEVTAWELWLKAGNAKAVKPLKQFPRARQPSSFISMWAGPLTASSDTVHCYLTQTVLSHDFPSSWRMRGRLLIRVRCRNGDRKWRGMDTSKEPRIQRVSKQELSETQRGSQRVKNIRMALKNLQ